MSQQQEIPHLQFNLGNTGVSDAEFIYLKKIFDHFDAHENDASKTRFLEIFINEYQGTISFPDHQAIIKKNINTVSYGNDRTKAMEDWPKIKQWLTPDPAQSSNINNAGDLDNLYKLFDTLNLPEISKDIANFLHFLGSSDELTPLFSALSLTDEKRIELMAVAIGRTGEDDLAQIKDLMSENGPFRKFGIINYIDGYCEDETPPLPALDKALLYRLLGHQPEASIIHHLIGEIVPTDITIPLNMFDLTEQQLSTALNADTGYSLLLDGPSGTGKTELCRTLAAEKNKTLIRISLAEIKNNLQQAAQSSKQAHLQIQRLKDHELLRQHVLQAIKLAERDPNIIILIDEAEKLLPPYAEGADNENDKEALHAIIEGNASIFLATNVAHRFHDSLKSRIVQKIRTKPLTVATLQQAWRYHAKKHGLNLADDIALNIARNYPNIDSRAISRVIQNIKQTLNNDNAAHQIVIPFDLITQELNSRDDILNIRGDAHFPLHFTPEIFVVEQHDTLNSTLENAILGTSAPHKAKKPGKRFLDMYNAQYPRSLFINTQPDMGEDELIAYISECLKEKLLIFDATEHMNSEYLTRFLENAFTSAAHTKSLLVIKNVEKIASMETSSKSWDINPNIYLLSKFIDQYQKAGKSLIVTHDLRAPEEISATFKNKFTEQWTLAALPPAQLKTALTKMLSFNDKDLEQWDEINSGLNKKDIRPDDIMALTAKIEYITREKGWQIWEDNQDKAQIIAEHLRQTQKDRQPLCQLIP